MESRSFRSAHKLASITIICLWGTLAFYLFDILYNLVFVAVFPDLGDSSDLTPSEAVMGLVALVLMAGRVLFGIATIVFFLMWLYRAYKNLEAFGVKNLETTAGWAVGYWFIPILNLFKPLKVVNEVYHGSKVENLENNFKFSDTGTPALNGFWWAFWLLSNILSRVAGNIEKFNKDVTEASIFIYVMALSFGILAGILLIFIIKDIDHHQSEGEGKISFLSPPPPTSFNLK